MMGIGVTNFSWPRPASEIGPTVAHIAHTADIAGPRCANTCSTMVAAPPMSEPIGPPADDPRLSLRLFTVAEAAGWLAVPRSTFHGWVHGWEYRRPGRQPVVGGPLVLSLPARRGQSAVPFLGLVEGLVLTGFRR